MTSHCAGTEQMKSEIRLRKKDGAAVTWNGRLFHGQSQTSGCNRKRSVADDRRQPSLSDGERLSPLRHYMYQTWRGGTQSFSAMVTGAKGVVRPGGRYFPWGGISRKIKKSRLVYGHLNAIQLAIFVLWRLKFAKFILDRRFAPDTRWCSAPRTPSQVG